MKKLLYFSILLTVLAACGKEGVPGDNHLRSMKLKRADLAGAHSLAMANPTGTKSGVTKSGEGRNLLYKVDADGTLTGVDFYATIDGVPGEAKVVLDLHEMVDLSENYFRLRVRSFSFSGDESVYLGGLYEGDVFYPFSEVIMRKSDGKLFALDPRVGIFAGNYYYHFDLPQEIADGRLFVSIAGHIYELSLGEEMSVAKQITSLYQDYRLFLADNGGNVLVFDRGNYLAGEYYLADGRVATAPEFSASYFIHSGEIYIMVVEEGAVVVSELQSAFPQTVVNEVARISLSGVYNAGLLFSAYQESAQSRFLQYFLINGKYIIDVVSRSGPGNSFSTTLGYDPETKTLSVVDAVPEDFALQTYDKDGYAWGISDDRLTITKYRITDLSKTTITCDRSNVPAFIRKGEQFLESCYVEFGIKTADGTPVRIQTDYATGAVTVFEDEDDRQIIEIFRLN